MAGRYSAGAIEGPRSPERTDVRRSEGRLRLCLAAPTYHPYYSGAAERFRRYLPEFRARGIDVTVLSATPTDAKAAPASGSEAWASLPNGAILPARLVDGVPVYRVRVPGEGGWARAAWFAHGLAGFCRKTGSPPEVVQLFHPSLAGTPSLWRIRRAGIPIVAARTMMPAPSRNPLKALRERISMRLAFSPVDCGIASSGVMLDALREMGLSQRFEVIPHGVDTARFHPRDDGAASEPIRKSLGIPPTARILLFVGSISQRKGIHWLLKAWRHLAARHPDLHLILAGPGWDREEAGDLVYLARLRRLAEESGATDRLHFPGRIPDVEAVMRASDVFVFPSTLEGMPNVVAEAMASGLPVVTCPFEGLSADFGTPGVHFVLTEFDSDRLARDITGLLEDSERRRQMAREAREWAESMLSWTHILDRYAELYRDLASARQAGP